MKTSSTRNFTSIAGRIMMGFVLAAVIGSIDVVPALSKDDHERNDRHDRGRYEERGRGHDRDRYERSRREYRHVHRERVYVAPRGIYEPPAPPGISIFFPPIIIHP